MSNYFALPQLVITRKNDQLSNNNNNSGSPISRLRGAFVTWVESTCAQPSGDEHPHSGVTSGTHLYQLWKEAAVQLVRDAVTAADARAAPSAFGTASEQLLAELARKENTAAPVSGVAPFKPETVLDAALLRIARPTLQEFCIDLLAAVSKIITLAAAASQNTKAAAKTTTTTTTNDAAASSAATAADSAAGGQQKCKAILRRVALFFAGEVTSQIRAALCTQQDGGRPHLVAPAKQDAAATDSARPKLRNALALLSLLSSGAAGAGAGAASPATATTSTPVCPEALTDVFRAVVRSPSECPLRSVCLDILFQHVTFFFRNVAVSSSSDTGGGNASSEERAVAVATIDAFIVERCRVLVGLLAALDDNENILLAASESASTATPTAWIRGSLTSFFFEAAQSGIARETAAQLSERMQHFSAIARHKLADLIAMSSDQPLVAASAGEGAAAPSAAAAASAGAAGEPQQQQHERPSVALCRVLLEHANRIVERHLVTAIGAHFDALSFKAVSTQEKKKEGGANDETTATTTAAAAAAAKIQSLTDADVVQKVNECISALEGPHGAVLIKQLRSHAGIMVQTWVMSTSSAAALSSSSSSSSASATAQKQISALKPETVAAVVQRLLHRFFREDVIAGVVDAAFDAVRNLKAAALPPSVPQTDIVDGLEALGCVGTLYRVDPLPSRVFPSVETTRTSLLLPWHIVRSTLRAALTLPDGVAEFVPSEDEQQQRQADTTNQDTKRKRRGAKAPLATFLEQRDNRSTESIASSFGAALLMIAFDMAFSSSSSSSSTSTSSAAAQRHQARPVAEQLKPEVLLQEQRLAKVLSMFLGIPISTLLPSTPGAASTNNNNNNVSAVASVFVRFAQSDARCTRAAAAICLSWVPLPLGISGGLPTYCETLRAQPGNGIIAMNSIFEATTCLSALYALEELKYLNYRQQQQRSPADQQPKEGSEKPRVSSDTVVVVGPGVTAAATTTATSKGMDALKCVVPGVALHSALACQAACGVLPLLFFVPVDAAKLRAPISLSNNNNKDKNDANAASKKAQQEPEHRAFVENLDKHVDGFWRALLSHQPAGDADHSASNNSNSNSSSGYYSFAKEIVGRSAKLLSRRYDTLLGDPSTRSASSSGGGGSASSALRMVTESGNLCSDVDCDRVFFYRSVAAMSWMLRYDVAEQNCALVCKALADVTEAIAVSQSYRSASPSVGGGGKALHSSVLHPLRLVAERAMSVFDAMNKPAAPMARPSALATSSAAPASPASTDGAAAATTAAATTGDASKKEGAVVGDDAIQKPETTVSAATATATTATPTAKTSASDESGEPSLSVLTTLSPWRYSKACSDTTSSLVSRLNRGSNNNNQSDAADNGITSNDPTARDFSPFHLRPFALRAGSKANPNSTIAGAFHVMSLLWFCTNYGCSYTCNPVLVESKHRSAEATNNRPHALLERLLRLVSKHTQDHEDALRAAAAGGSSNNNSNNQSRAASTPAPNLYHRQLISSTCYGVYSAARPTPSPTAAAPATATCAPAPPPTPLPTKEQIGLVALLRASLIPLSAKDRPDRTTDFFPIVTGSAATAAASLALEPARFAHAADASCVSPEDFAVALARTVFCIALSGSPMEAAQIVKELMQNVSSRDPVCCQENKAVPPVAATTTATGSNKDAKPAADKAASGAAASSSAATTTCTSIASSPEMLVFQKLKSRRCTTLDLLSMLRTMVEMWRMTAANLSPHELLCGGHLMHVVCDLLIDTAVTLPTVYQAEKKSATILAAPADFNRQPQQQQHRGRDNITTKAVAAFPGSAATATPAAAATVAASASSSVLFGPPPVSNKYAEMFLSEILFDLTPASSFASAGGGSSGAPAVRFIRDVATMVQDCASACIKERVGANLTRIREQLEANNFYGSDTVSNYELGTLYGIRLAGTGCLRSGDRCSEVRADMRKADDGVAQRVPRGARMSAAEVAAALQMRPWVSTAGSVAAELTLIRLAMYAVACPADSCMGALFGAETDLVRQVVKQREDAEYARDRKDKKDRGGGGGGRERSRERGGDRDRDRDGKSRRGGEGDSGRSPDRRDRDRDRERDRDRGGKSSSSTTNNTSSHNNNTNTSGAGSGGGGGGGGRGDGRRRSRSPRTDADHSRRHKEDVRNDDNNNNNNKSSGKSNTSGGINNNNNNISNSNNRSGRDDRGGDRDRDRDRGHGGGGGGSRTESRRDDDRRRDDNNNNRSNNNDSRRDDHRRGRR